MIEDYIKSGTTSGEKIVSLLRRIIYIWLEMKDEGFDQTVLEIDGFLFKEPSKTVVKLEFVDDDEDCHCGINIIDPRADDPEIMPQILQQALDFIEKERAALFVAKKDRVIFSPTKNATVH
jgi:hypothetical protein